MALNTSKNRQAVVKFGGGIIKVRTCSPSGGAPYGSVVDLGYIQETTWQDVTETTPIADETGEAFKISYDSRSVKLTGVLMQTDANVLAIPKEVPDQFYEVYYKMHPNIGGKVQELLIAVAQIKPAVEVNSNTRRVPIEIIALKNENALTGISLATVYGGTATSVNVNVG